MIDYHKRSLEDLNRKEFNLAYKYMSDKFKLLNRHIITKKQVCEIALQTGNISKLKYHEFMCL